MMEETIVVVKKVDRAWQQWKCYEEMNRRWMDSRRKNEASQPGMEKNDCFVNV
jgi:hypothetical protein